MFLQKLVIILLINKKGLLTIFWNFCMESNPKNFVEVKFLMVVFSYALYVYIYKMNSFRIWHPYAEKAGGWLYECVIIKN